MGYFYKQLEQYERDLLAQYVSEGFSFTDIGRILDRSASTVSREYRRNKIDDNTYLPSDAHARSQDRKSESSCRESKCEPHQQKIYDLLRLGWTPEQIASELEKLNKDFSVSYETIYCYIYKYHIEWAKLLPRKHAPRWNKGMGKKKSKRGMIPNRTCITERLTKIDDKSEFGHWEGDSIVCSQSVISLNVMVERQTQYVCINLVGNRGPEVAKNAMVEALGYFPGSSVKSITLDNGIEFKYHEALAEEMNMDTYFCQPYHSWEKGLVEQINGLIRRFLPKKTDLSTISEKEVRLIEYLLNSRPRKLLGFATPAEIFAKKSGMKLVGGALAT